MGGATMIYKSRGIKKVLIKTKDGPVWVEEKLEPTHDEENALSPYQTKAEHLPAPPKRSVVAEQKRKTARGERKRAPVISLSEPGRLRVADVISLLGISRSTFYAGLDSGRYPQHDGKDGNIRYWKTSTIKSFLES